MRIHLYRPLPQQSFHDDDRGRMQRRDDSTHFRRVNKTLNTPIPFTASGWIDLVDELRAAAVIGSRRLAAC